VTQERRDMLAQVAVWYYEDRLDQAAIAERIGKSRSMVSRMLNEVRELGLVEVRVKYPLKRSAQLENALIERFRLKGAWVMARPEGVSDAFSRRLLGRTAAACLQRYIADGIRIGVAWSRTLHHMVVEVAEQVVRDAMVVQISGSVAVDNPNFDGPELVRKLAHKLGAEYRYFPAPLVVRDADLKRSLLQESAIVEALRVGECVDVAVLGIGNVLSAESSLRSSGLVDDATLHELVVNDVAGDIIARQFDPQGSLLGVAFNERVVGMDPAALKRVPTVIAVSNGAEKSRSILAGIRGGWFNVLVSDASTVTELLAYADMHDETEGK
jgi:deoxyribonucleoside regulator